MMLNRPCLMEKQSALFSDSVAHVLCDCLERAIVSQKMLVIQNIGCAKLGSHTNQTVGVGHCCAI